MEERKEESRVYTLEMAEADIDCVLEEFRRKRVAKIQKESDIQKLVNDNDERAPARIYYPSITEEEQTRELSAPQREER